MAAKVQETEQKKASKAWFREGEKGQWWPSEVTDLELKAFEKEGFIALGSWSFQKYSSIPTPDSDERVFTKAWVERGLSLPPPNSFYQCLALTASSLTTYAPIPFFFSPIS